jgi:ureidoacrylate peracid hydrolase
MHEIKIAQWAVDRAMERRGKRHVHEDLDPRKTALIVVDLQNGFMVEEVAAAYVPVAVEIVPNVNKLAAAVRRTGGKVFWIRQTVDDDSAVAWSEWLGMMTPATRRNLVANLAPGSRGHEIYPDLEVKPEDEVVLKYRFSAFLQGASDLPQRLRAQGYDTVLITGTVTNVCCESSARDAMQLNFKTVMVTDANAALTDEEHNWSLINFYNALGDIMSTDMVIACLRDNARKALAAAE